MWVGVDGCRAGWISFGIAGPEDWRFALHADADNFWRNWRVADLILVDIPIGLVSRGGGRRCDLDARKVLGPRKFSVFPAPSRACFDAASYRDGSEANRTATGRGLSKQSWSLIEKIRNVDELLQGNAAARSKIREVHPELLFWGMNGKRPLEHPKRRNEGFRERLRILKEHFSEAETAADEALRSFPRSQVAADDVLDALAASVVGWRSDGRLERLPPDAETDEVGLPMEMVYWSSAGLPAR